jgi:hypothetical protein
MQAAVEVSTAQYQDGKSPGVRPGEEEKANGNRTI